MSIVLMFLFVTSNILEVVLAHVIGIPLAEQNSPIHIE